MSDLNVEQPIEQPEQSPKTGIIVAGIIVGVLIIIAVAFFATKDLRAYNKAGKQMEAGEYQQAYEQYETLGDYKDAKSQKKLAEQGIKYNEALQLKEKEEYAESLEILTDLDFEDSEQQVTEVKYLLAKQLMDEEDTASAITYLEDLNYQDSEDLLVECKYITGKAYFDQEEYDLALTYLEGLDYQDSAEMVEEINNPYTIKKFIKRYNVISTALQASGVTMSTLSEDMFASPEADLESTGRIVFNESGDQENFKKNITSVKYTVNNSSSLNQELVSGELLAVIGAMTQDESLQDLTVILTELMEGSGAISNNGVNYAISSDYNTATLVITVE